MSQDRRIGVQGFHVLQSPRLEFFMHDAGSIPEQHVYASLALYIGAQVLVRCPQNLFPGIHQVLDNIDGNTGSHYPVRARLHRGRGIGIHHHGTLRVLIAELAETIDGTGYVQRTGCFQGRHQYFLVRTEDLCRLTHEAYPRHNQDVGIAVMTEAGHLKAVPYEATAVFCQFLQQRIGIVMRNQFGILLCHQRLDLFAITCHFVATQGPRKLCPVEVVLDDFSVGSECVGWDASHGVAVVWIFAEALV